MTSHIVDAIASGSSPSEITQEIKDVLFAKSNERIDDYRYAAAANLFVNQEDSDEEEE